MGMVQASISGISEPLLGLINHKNIVLRIVLLEDLHIFWSVVGASIVHNEYFI
jgi:hypothetical protein